MTAQELIDVAVGIEGVQAHAALDMILGDDRYDLALEDIHQIIVMSKGVKRNGKLTVTFNWDQLMVLVTYYATGKKLIRKIDEMLEKEEQDDSQTEA